MFGLKKAAAGLGRRWSVELDDHVIALEWAPGGHWLAAGLVGGPVAILAAATGERVATLPGHNVGTTSVSWARDGRTLVTGGQDGKVRMWAAETAELLSELDAGAPWVEKVVCGPSSHQVLSAAGKVLRLWSAQGKFEREYAAHPSTIADVAWQGDAGYFTTVTYGRLAMFRSGESEPVRTFEWKGSILRVAWSPDGNYVATGNQDASVHFWYRKSGKDLEMTGYASKVRELAWDAGSRYLATGGSPVVIVWDCAGKGPAGSRPIQLRGHEAMLSALAYQRRGGLLVSGCRNGRLCLWRPDKGETVLAVTEMDSEVSGVQWAPGDREVAASTAAGRLQVWQLSEE
jgi:WD40 repeat protein